MSAPAWLVDRLVDEVRAIEAEVDSAECASCALIETKADMAREGNGYLCLVCESKRWEYGS